jgi:hypothetical protein
MFLLFNWLCLICGFWRAWDKKSLKQNLMFHKLSVVLHVGHIAFFKRRVWRYQRGNQNPLIEGQKTQWLKEKGEKDKQRSTKHTHKAKDQVAWIPQKPGEVRYSGRISRSCSTSGIKTRLIIKTLHWRHCLQYTPRDISNHYTCKNQKLKRHKINV